MQKITTIQLKQHKTNACVFSIIVYKLDYWQQPCLIILLKNKKGSEIQFYYFVLSFGLPINYKIEYIKIFFLIFRKYQRNQKKFDVKIDF